MTRKKPGPAKRGARKAAKQPARKAAVVRKAPARRTPDIVSPAALRTGYQVGAGNEGVTLPPGAVPPIV